MTFEQPHKLDRALDVLGALNPKILAGGTDVFPAMQKGRQPGSFLDVTRIEGLRGISESDGTIRIGAATTWSDIVKSDLPPAFDALKEAALEVGSLQIQNAGTIAGNICNASPAADGVPPLLCLDARVEIASAERGLRQVDLSSFITGVRQTDLAADELVTAVLVPSPPEGMHSAFEKLGSRRYLVISISMTSAHLLLDGQGRIAEARIAVGSCSTVAQRLPLLEADLTGARPSDITVTAEHLSPLSPIDDVRGTATYRREAARAQCERAILKAVAS